MNSSEINQKYLVTGAAGFVGMYIAIHLLEQEHEVVGIDNQIGISSLC